MEVLTIPHLSASHNLIHFSIFHSVSNLAALLSCLRAGKPDETLSQSVTPEVLSQYAFLNASVIASRQHVLNAVLEALTRKESGDMKTRSWSTEVMWILWPGGNISDSLKQIGLGIKVSSLVVVRIAPSAGAGAAHSASILSEMTSLVQGSLDLRGFAAFEEAAAADEITDWNKLAQMHKLLPSFSVHTAEDRRKIRNVAESATAIKNVAT